MDKKRLTLAAFLLIGSAGSPCVPSFAQPAQVPPPCLHGPSEQPAQRTRREQALKLAQEINRAENPGPTVVPGQPRMYKLLDQVAGLPPTPNGFAVQLNTEGGDTYALSVKDTLDPCHYAIFSDQDRYLYEAIARTGVEVRRLETRR